MTVSERLQNQAIDRFWETVPPLWGMIRTHIRAEATKNFDITVEQFHILRHVRPEQVPSANWQQPRILVALPSARL